MLTVTAIDGPVRESRGVLVEMTPTPSSHSGGAVISTSFAFLGALIAAVVGLLAGIGVGFLFLRRTGPPPSAIQAPSPPPPAVGGTP